MWLCFLVANYFNHFIIFITFFVFKDKPDSKDFSAQVKFPTCCVSHICAYTLRDFLWSLHLKSQAVCVCKSHLNTTVDIYILQGIYPYLCLHRVCYYYHLYYQSISHTTNTTLDISVVVSQIKSTLIKKHNREVPACILNKPCLKNKQTVSGRGNILVWFL